MRERIVRTRLSREESQAQTRERLLDAARRLFVLEGFAGTSIRDIAAEAGYSQGAFYSNFPDKEAVLLELLQRHKEAEAQRLSVVVEAAGGADGVLAGLEAWMTTLDADADWGMLAVELQLHASRSPAFAAAYREAWEGQRIMFGHLVGRLFARLGRVPPAAPEDLAAGFMALSHGLALQRAVAAPDAAGRTIVTFLRGIIASAARTPAGGG